ncbi:MAG: hypothetical protein ACLQVD_01070 [Capsulimonadaceae bacterium]
MGHDVFFGHFPNVIQGTAVLGVPALGRWERAGSKGLSFTLLPLVLGWWGFPCGPINTIGAIIENGKGVKDVTQQMIGRIMTAAAQSRPPTFAGPNLPL